MNYLLSNIVASTCNEKFSENGYFEINDQY